MSQTQAKEASKAPVVIYRGRFVERRKCGERFLPMNSAFENTAVLEKAPQSWNFRQCGAKWWA